MSSNRLSKNFIFIKCRLRSGVVKPLTGSEKVYEFWVEEHGLLFIVNRFCRILCKKFLHCMSEIIGVFLSNLLIYFTK